MASGKNYLARPSYRCLGGDRENSIRSESVIEFDESDIWNTNHTAAASSPEFKKMMIPSSRASKKSGKRVVDNGGDCHRSAGATGSSLPVNIPDWSKILKEDYRDCRRRGTDGDVDDDDDNDSEEGRIPPHEYVARQLARNGVSSFSVHEGIGRTLKGRDLSRVRNAIWEKTGFQD